jgi:hypothetical protein
MVEYFLSLIHNDARFDVEDLSMPPLLSDRISARVCVACTTTMDAAARDDPAWLYCSKVP